MQATLNENIRRSQLTQGHHDASNSGLVVSENDLTKITADVVRGKDWSCLATDRQGVGELLWRALPLLFSGRSPRRNSSVFCGKVEIVNMVVNDLTAALQSAPYEAPGKQNISLGLSSLSSVRATPSTSTTEYTLYNFYDFSERLYSEIFNLVNGHMWVASVITGMLLALPRGEARFLAINGDLLLVYVYLSLRVILLNLKVLTRRSSNVTGTPSIVTTSGIYQHVSLSGLNAESNIVRPLYSNSRSGIYGSNEPTSSLTRSQSALVSGMRNVTGVSGTLET